MTEISARSAVAPETFRQTLAVHAAGVVVVTAAKDGAPIGCTITSFTSASLCPPLVSFYLDRSSRSARQLSSAGQFAVNILSSDQAELAARFARKDIDRFAWPTRWHVGLLGIPVLDDVCAQVICSPHQRADIGDHILMAGLVVAMSYSPARQPLVYSSRQFGDFVPRRNG